MRRCRSSATLKSVVEVTEPIISRLESIKTMISLAHYQSLTRYKSQLRHECAKARKLGYTLLQIW